MKHLVHIRFYLFAFMLVGCGTPGLKNESARGPAKPQDKISETQKAKILEYSHHVDAKTLRDLNKRKAICPKTTPNLKSGAWAEALKLASACAEFAQWSQVEALGQHLAVHEPLAAWGPYLLGVAAEGQGDLQRAMWMNELALKKAPEEGILIYQRGRILFALRDEERAIESFKQAVAVRPELAEAQLILGQVADEKGDAKSASAYYQKALNADPSLLSAMLGLANNQMKSGDGKGAESTLEMAMSSYPKSYRARLMMAQTQESVLKNHEKSLNVYRRLREMDRDKRLDSPLDLDVDKKIHELESEIKKANLAANSKRQPADEKEKRTK